jgi:hypothetical protein
MGSLLTVSSRESVASTFQFIDMQAVDNLIRILLRGAPAVCLIITNLVKALPFSAFLGLTAWWWGAVTLLVQTHLPYVLWHGQRRTSPAAVVSFALLLLSLVSYFSVVYAVIHRSPLNFNFNISSTSRCSFALE